MKKQRPDHQGPHRRVYERNRKKILATQEVCAICGLPVDKAIRFPDPMAGVVDHIIPINKGGHPSDISNLQLTHHWCNRQKSDKLITQGGAGKDKKKKETITNRDLPQAMDWKAYRPT